MNYISQDHLRSWFVKTWESLYGGWPTFNEINRICFSDLLPGLLKENNDFLFTTTPAVTTLINENEIIQDCWYRRQANEEETDHDNYLRSKTKPLGVDCFIARNGSAVLSVDRQKRIRNKINDEFLTEEDSLFVQELIPKGTRFGGNIVIKGENDEFNQQALHIFRNINPIINGNLLTSIIEENMNSETEEGGNGTPYLVSRPIPLNFDLLQKENNILMDSEVRYSTVFNRPKRNRVAVAGGSLIHKRYGVPWKDYCIDWPGFKNNDPIPLIKIKGPLIKKEPPPLSMAGEEDDSSQNKIVTHIKEFKITKSQAGFLRGLLNEKNDLEAVENVLTERVNKLQSKEGGQDKAVMEMILKELKTKNINSMRSLLKQYLETLAVLRWDEGGADNAAYKK
jgi:hypothetical protein